MKIAFCTDSEGGISFNGRRVSRDAVILGDLHKRAERVFAFPEAESLFSKAGIPVETATGGINGVVEGLLFLEQEPSVYYGRAEEIISYNFNRSYPADVKVKIHPTAAGFVPVKEEELTGQSHEKITVTVFVKGDLI